MRNILAALILATTFLGGTVTHAPAQSLNQVQTDPYNNKGNKLFQKMHDAAGGGLVPNIVYPYLPSGSVVNNAWNKDARDAPDIGAVESIILFLAQSFKVTANSGQTGKWLWKLTILFCTVGVLLSGFLTFKAVSQGKKGPGEGLVSFLVKVCATVILVTVVCPNIPPTLIGISNTITQGIDQWFYRSTGDNEALVTGIYNSKMASGTGAARLVYQNLVSVLSNYKNDADPAVVQAAEKALAEIRGNQQIREAVGVNYPSRAQADIANLVGMLKSGKTSNDVNAAISGLATNLPGTVIVQIQNIANKYFKENSSKQADQAIMAAIAGAPRSLDLTSLMQPPRVVTTYAYIAFSYLSIGIWGIGFASLIWVILYSMPEEFNYGGILFTGFKGCAGVVLSIVLISIYMASGLNWIDRKSEDFIAKEPESFLESTWQAVSGAAGWVYDKASSAAGSVKTAADIVTDPGSLPARIFGFFTGASLEQFMIGILVLTAPAQAALMMKGANGIAEHAKQALNANGAASQSVGGALGLQRGTSGMNEGGGAGFSPQSVYSGAGADRSAIMAPSNKGAWGGSSSSPLGSVGGARN